MKFCGGHTDFKGLTALSVICDLWLCEFVMCKPTLNSA